MSARAPDRGRLRPSRARRIEFVLTTHPASGTIFVPTLPRPAAAARRSRASPSTPRLQARRRCAARARELAPRARAERRPPPRHAAHGRRDAAFAIGRRSLRRTTCCGDHGDARPAKNGHPRRTPQCSWPRRTVARRHLSISATRDAHLGCSSVRAHVPSEARGASTSFSRSPRPSCCSAAITPAPAGVRRHPALAPPGAHVARGRRAPRANDRHGRS